MNGDCEAFFSFSFYLEIFLPKYCFIILEFGDIFYESDKIKLSFLLYNIRALFLAVGELISLSMNVNQSFSK